MKITPAELCTKPVCFDVSGSTYDHVAQRRMNLDTTMAITHRATQTHPSGGKPIDSDND